MMKGLSNPLVVVNPRKMLVWLWRGQRQMNPSFSTKSLWNGACEWMWMWMYYTQHFPNPEHRQMPITVALWEGIRRTPKMDGSHVFNRIIMKWWHLIMSNLSKTNHQRSTREGVRRTPSRCCCSLKNIYLTFVKSKMDGSLVFDWFMMKGWHLIIPDLSNVNHHRSMRKWFDEPFCCWQSRNNVDLALLRSETDGSLIFDKITMQSCLSNANY